MKHKVYMNYIHSSSMLSYFSELWKNGSLCDLVITVDSMVVAKAHRLVLLAASPKLQADHSNTSTPLVSDICMPGNVSIESIETCLAYIYDGILELNEGNISDVKKIAEYLHIEQLLHCCIDFSENIMGNSDKLPDINKTFHIKKSNLMDSSSKSSTACKKCSNQSNSSFKFAAGVSNTNSGNEDIYSDNSSNTVSNESFDIGNNSASNIPRSVKRQKLSEDSFRTPSREPVTIKIDDDEATIVKMEPDDSEHYTNMSEPYPVSFVPSSHSDETTGNNVGSSMQTVSSSSHNLQPSTSQDIDAESCSTGLQRVEYVLSCRGKQQISSDGYLYSKQCTGASTQHWRCTLKSCKGRLVTAGDHIKSTSEHNHPPVDPICHKFMSNLRRRARNEITPMTVIYKEEIGHLDSESVHLMPSFNTIKSGLYRHRKTSFSSQSSALRLCFEVPSDSESTSVIENTS